MRNVSTSYMPEEEYEEKAFMISEMSFDGECEMQYIIKPSISTIVNVTKNIDYSYCQSSTSSYNNLLQKKLRNCKNRKTGIEFELKGNIQNYAFEKSFYKSSCTSADENGGIEITTIMKMFLFSDTKKLSQELDDRENSESLMYCNEIGTSWNLTLTPPAVCNERTCDWRTVPGAVTGIKDQGPCNTCYAFSSIAALESFQFNFMTGTSIVLSEQNFQDCLPSKPGQNWKCTGTGGDPQKALSLIHTIGGIHALKDYPWGLSRNHVTKKIRCRRLQKKEVVTGNEFVAVKVPGLTTNERLMTLIRTYGPTVNSVTKKKMLRIKGERIIIDNCLGSNDHAVNVVGWDTEGDVRYWIVKNSWGPEYGDGGYHYIKMSNGDYDCNIKSEIVFLQPTKL